MDASSPPSVEPKEEPDVFGVDDDKRAVLLKMNFSAKEVDSATETLGMDAPIDEIVDFIIAAQVAANFDTETYQNLEGEKHKSEDVSNECLFGTMDKTLRLLELGFSENEISLAIEKFGSDVPVLELANYICAEQVGEKYTIQDQRQSGMNRSRVASDSGSSSMHVELRELFSPNLEGIHRGKRPKQEYSEDYPGTNFWHVSFEDSFGNKRLKPEYPDEPSSYYGAAWNEQKFAENAEFRIHRAPKPDSCESVDRMVAKPPYFFFGHVANVPFSTWGKISQFLYATEPEFVNTGWFSALSRKEGYVHNLPTEDRFHILPIPPMSIEEAMPHLRKWWPSWDTRKQLSCISYETSEVSQLCDGIGRMLTNSRGILSSEQIREIVHQCQRWNLIWVDLNKMEPIGPEYLELILGYPLNHTQVADSSLTERLHSLAYCFQVDTLGYHVSALKYMFPEGLTMLSLASGIGGAEIALHRLGIHMKAVVSVETCETRRRILRRWWGSSGQTGVLEQIESIQKLTTKRIDGLISRFRGFDLVVCQSPSGSRKTGDEDFDMSLFHEFVRVLQRVRSLMGRRR